MGEAIRRWLNAQVERFGVVAAFWSVAASLLITAIGVVLVAFILPFSSANRDVALGDAFAAGVLLFAVVAAVVAVLAYAQSSRRPTLTTSWWFESLTGKEITESEFPRDSSGRTFDPGDPAPTARLLLGTLHLVALEDSKLTLMVENTGDVAAKNVTVLLRLEGVYFSPVPTVNPPWSLHSTDQGWKVQWEGGLDRPAYPGGVPRTPRLALTGMWALSEIEHSEFGQIVTMADDLKEPENHPLVIGAAPLPVAGRAGPPPGPAGLPAGGMTLSSGAPVEDEEREGHARPVQEDDTGQTDS